MRSWATARASGPGATSTPRALSFSTDSAGGGIGGALQHGHVEAQPRRGQGQHAAQLSAPEDAEGGAGRKRKLGHHACLYSTASETLAVCCCANAARRSARA